MSEQPSNSLVLSSNVRMLSLVAAGPPARSVAGFVAKLRSCREIAVCKNRDCTQLCTQLCTHDSLKFPDKEKMQSLGMLIGGGRLKR